MSKKNLYKYKQHMVKTMSYQRFAKQSAEYSCPIDFINHGTDLGTPLHVSMESQM